MIDNRDKAFKRRKKEIKKQQQNRTVCGNRQAIAESNHPILCNRHSVLSHCTATIYVNIYTSHRTSTKRNEEKKIEKRKKTNSTKTKRKIQSKNCCSGFGPSKNKQQKTEILFLPSKKEGKKGKKKHRNLQLKFTKKKNNRGTYTHKGIASFRADA